MANVDKSVLAEVAAGTYYQPHSILGPHVADGVVTVRALRPLASAVAIETLDGTYEATHEHHGVWVAELPGKDAPDYRLHVTYDAEPMTMDDPYRFLPTLGEIWHRCKKVAFRHASGLRSSEVPLSKGSGKSRTDGDRLSSCAMRQP